MKNVIISLLVGYILGGSMLLQAIFGSFLDAITDPMFWLTTGFFGLLVILPFVAMGRVSS